MEKQYSKNNKKTKRLEMEAHLTHVLNGIARSMAPAGLKKELSLEAVRLASQERVQQRLPPRLRCWDHLFKDFAQDRVQRLVDQLKEVLEMVSHAESSGELSTRSSTSSLRCARSEFL